MEKVKEVFKLPQETVLVKPNLTNPGWVKNPRHVAFFKLEGAFDMFTVAMSRNGTLKNPFTDAEKNYLTEVLQLDSKELSVYTANSFLRLQNIRLGKDPVKLDLSQPDDFIKYKILLTNTDKVAPSVKDVKKKGTYKYYIEREADVTSVNKEKGDINKTAWKEYGKMEENKGKLAAFLKVYSRVMGQPAKKIDKSTKLDFLQGQVSAIIEANTKQFAEIVDNPNYDTILLIAEAVEKGIIVAKGTNYFLKGGTDKLGSSLIETVSYLNNAMNQELKLTIEQQIKD